MDSYTAQLANDPSRWSNRTTIRFGVLNSNGLFPTSQVCDRYILGPLSLLTGLGMVTTITALFIALIPSILFSKYIMGWPSALNLPKSSSSSVTNTSNTAVGSITAIKTLYVRSQMFLQQTGGPDYIAPLLMRQLSLFGPNIPGSRFVTHIYSVLSRWNFYLTGRVFMDQISELCFSKLIKFGEVGLLQSRTCWLDDVLESFVKSHEGEKINVVILGAGYDTRCYRFFHNSDDNDNVRLYEIDAVGSQESKKRVLNHAKVDSSHVQFVSCDFETEDWMVTLQSKSNFDKHLPSLFIWEGVSYYLDENTVVSTISKISRCEKGSCIAFDYFDKSCLNSTMRKGAKSIGEPLKFGIENVDIFLSDCNKEQCSSSGEVTAVHQMQILDHLRCNELKKRYVPQYNERYIGYLSEFGGFLLLGS